MQIQLGCYHEGPGTGCVTKWHGICFTGVKIKTMHNAWNGTMVCGCGFTCRMASPGVHQYPIGILRQVFLFPFPFFFSFQFWPYSLMCPQHGIKHKAAINNSKHWWHTVIAALCFIPFCGHINKHDHFYIKLCWVGVYWHVCIYHNLWKARPHHIIEKCTQFIYSIEYTNILER